MTLPFCLNFGNTREKVAVFHEVEMKEALVGITELTKIHPERGDGYQNKRYKDLSHTGSNKGSAG